MERQRHLSAEIDAVSRDLRLLAHRAPPRSDETPDPSADEAALLRELDRLMDRLRATEGALRALSGEGTERWA